MLNLQSIRDYLGYDPETGVFRWIARAPLHRMIVGEVAGSVKPSTGYRRIKFGGKEYRAGRLAWFFVHGDMPPRNLVPDHINGVRDDNRIENLRLATDQQNQFNRGPRRNSSSKFKGVCYVAHANRWQAGIKLNGKSLHLGWFEKEESAAHAYDVAAKKHFGEFARLNIPEARA